MTISIIELLNKLFTEKILSIIKEGTVKLSMKKVQNKKQR